MSTTPKETPGPPVQDAAPEADDQNDRSELRAWLTEEALNLEKILSGVPRLDFVEWRKRREERGRTVRSGNA